MFCNNKQKNLVGFFHLFVSSSLLVMVQELKLPYEAGSILLSGRSRNSYDCLAVLFLFDGRMSAGFYNGKIVVGLAFSH